jgi:hypothetical protein
MGEAFSRRLTGVSLKDESGAYISVMRDAGRPILPPPPDHSG